MANLKEIRNRIGSVRNIEQVTRAMKMVAAVKMRRAQERMEQARPYTRRLEGVIHSLLPDIDRSLLPLLELREVQRVAYVVVTSDRGLAGSFNSSVIRRAEEEIGALKEKVELICIGRKGQTYFQRRDYRITGEYTDFWKELDFGHAVSIGQGIVTKFISREVDEIRVVYNEFQNVVTQVVRSRRLLPLVYEGEAPPPGDRLYEPSRNAIVLALIPRHFNVQVWQFLLESYASEQAARMMAMENATENAQEMIKSLTLEFNQARQAAITKEMLEIVSGAEALA